MKFFVLVFSAFLVNVSHAWVSHTNRPVRMSATVASADVTTSTVDEIKESLLNSISFTDRGRSASEEQRQELEEQFQALEEKCEIQEPARSSLVEGRWTVEYTDAPPPSNGQLGPFSGIAQQDVGLSNRSYQNILRVPPNDWLSASLDASWEEWDGVLLEDARKQPNYKKESVLCASPDASRLAMGGGKDENPSSTDAQDNGASCWLVTFETLTVRLFGIPLVSQKFDNTKRIWRTTYVDENTRIVRAGRTGKIEDEMIFYMTRA